MPELKNDLEDVIRDACGAEPGDTIEIRGPVFHRTDEMPTPSCAPSTKEGFDQLKKLDKTALIELGIGQWDGKLWVFPGEWYHSIPAGYLVTDIFYAEEPFQPGVTDNDIRFGCLSYGFVPDFAKDMPIPED